MDGRIIDIKRMAVHDGPGIRTTIFVKGCPLACRWCHNPESISCNSEVGYHKNKCVSCGRCVSVCPSGAHEIVNGVHVFNREKCTACGKCVEVCLPGALEYFGRVLKVDEAISQVLEDKNFYDKSGGGCTISGGEPLLQPDFCVAVFRRLKECGVHCAVDTCGAVPWSNFEKVLPYADMFLFDVKHVDCERHKEHTGVPNDIIKENLTKLSGLGVKIEIRVPLIPGFNLDYESLRGIGGFVAGLPNPVSGVRLLAYHDFARSKYETIGRPDSMPRVEPPTQADLEHAEAVVKASGAPVCA